MSTSVRNNEATAAAARSESARLDSALGRARPERGSGLVFVGTSHRRARLELRERLYLDPDEAANMARALVQDVGEAAVLSTCNRTEVYIVDSNPDTAAVRGCAEFARRAKMPGDDLAATLEIARDSRAALHLLRVAAGLDSLVPAESQILGQVRDAHEAASAVGATGPILNRLFRQALHAGKRVRSETAIAEQPGSVPAAAVRIVRRLCGDLDGRRILVIGAGKVAELAAADLVAGGARNIFITSRTLSRARRLAVRLEGEAATFDALAGELERADVVISSTRCPGIVLSAEQVAEAIRHRRRRPLLFIDLAVPRDLDPAIRALDGCVLYDIDDLAEPGSESPSANGRELARAEAILLEELTKFDQWQRTLEVVPAIAALHRRGEQIRAAELERARGRLGALSPRERRAVEALTGRIVSRLLHTPTVRMKEAALAPDGLAYADAVQHLFWLEEAET